MSGQRKALIIASDEYEQEALRDLPTPKASPSTKTKAASAQEEK